MPLLDDFDSYKVETNNLAEVDLKGLEAFAFLYTATEKGTNSGIRFMATIEDAKKWCSSDNSKGVIKGTRWAYMFTTVANFIGCHWGLEKPVLDIRKMKDNGEWDERIAATGCHKIGFDEFKKVLSPFGLVVVDNQNDSMNEGMKQKTSISVQQLDLFEALDAVA